MPTDEPVDRPFGELLRAYRERAGLSQKKLAEALGVSQGYLSKVERGVMLPTDRGFGGTDALASLSASGLSAAEIERLEEAFERKKPVERPPELEFVTLEKDRERQDKAKTVWVVARQPLELSDPNYRELVLDGIRRTPPRQYVYWTAYASWFDIFRAYLLRSLEKLHTSLEAGEIVRRSIKCIEAPSPAGWFSFVVYDANEQGPLTGRAYLYLDHVASGGTHVAAIAEVETFRRLALPQMKLAYAGLVDAAVSTFHDEDGDAWSLYFPTRDDT